MRNAGIALVLAALFASGAVAQQGFQPYIAIGDSLTAGYASGGLAGSYQVNSYPALIAFQLGIAGFQQPLISDPGIPNVLELKQLNVVGGQIVPTIAPKSGDRGLPINAQLQGPYNNYGIPGAKVADLLTRTGDIMRLQQSPPPADIASTIMYDLILRMPTIPGTQTPGTALNWALAGHGAFYTVWAGNNDVLGAALSGVALEGVTLTPIAAFEQSYQTLLGTIHQVYPDAKILVATVPDVTAIPFVTTVRPFVTTPDGQQLFLQGADGPLTASDYLTLPASSLIQQGMGLPGGPPLPEGSVDQTGLHQGVILRAAEIEAIRARTTEINDVIREVAGTFGAGVVDINAVFADIAAHGRVVGGIRLTPAFLTGGVFSYDGVHPNAIGSALIANEFIAVLNEEFDEDIEPVELAPFVFGAQAATTVFANRVVFSEEAWASLLRTFVASVESAEPGDVRRPPRVRLRSSGRATRD